MKRLLFAISLIMLLLSGCRTRKIESSGLGTDNSITTYDPQKIEDVTTKNKYDPSAPPPKFSMPTLWYEFTNAPIKNSPGERSKEAYLAVILQFGVEGYQCRYNPPCDGNKNTAVDTRCNIFASDVMNAMGAPLPTKGELGHGAAGSEKTDRMPAIASDIHKWLNEQHDGWRKLDINNPTDWEILMKHIAAGKPALASHPDHIAVIRPDQPSDLAVGKINEIHIAQAGALNSNDTLVRTAFRNRTVDVYIHD